MATHASCLIVALAFLASGVCLVFGALRASGRGADRIECAGGGLLAASFVLLGFCLGSAAHVRQGLMRPLAVPCDQTHVCVPEPAAYRVPRPAILPPWEPWPPA